MSTSFQIEQLAAAIGEEIYLEIAKWRLYLNDAHLHTPLAELLFPLVESGKLDRASVEKAMESLMVPIGGGKSSLPLMVLVPNGLMPRLIDVLQDYRERLSP